MQQKQDVKEYYEILGIDDSATSVEIKKAYRRKALQFFPDKHWYEYDMKKVTEAYEVFTQKLFLMFIVF